LLRYCPPEVASAILNNTVSRLTAQPAFDSWSAGMVVLELFEGQQFVEHGGAGHNETLQRVASRTFCQDLHRQLATRFARKPGVLEASRL
jgi:hypothetical protein